MLLPTWLAHGFKSCPRVGGIGKCTAARMWPPCFKSCPRVGGIIIIPGWAASFTGFKSCPRVGGIKYG